MLLLLCVLLCLQGREYSCYSLAHQGRLVAHADTTAALSNLNYKYEGAHANHLRIWIAVCSIFA
jgi:hypothetical protein